MAKNWYDVNKEGLAKILEQRGKAFAIFELIQNSWDTDAKCVTVQLTPIEGRPLATLHVSDDSPGGFKDLSHAYTMFAESEKKGDPLKRGRFNLGEKLVLALCESAEIISTTGSVYFTKEGRTEGRKKLQAGSTFVGTIRMTRDELAEAERAVRTLLPPLSDPTMVTSFNGVALPYRAAIEQIVNVTLPTEIADAEGYIRKSQRQTTVTIHDVNEDEEPHLYEMGIPVVPLLGGERWHVNVHQKIPLNVDRDNVTPAYLQSIRVLLANAMKDALEKDDVKRPWMEAATDDERCTFDTMKVVLDHRFGKNRASFDPSDPEANKALMNEGVTIVPGGSLSKQQWANAKAGGLIVAAGIRKPSLVTYGDGPPEKVIERASYTKEQAQAVEYAERLAYKLMKIAIEVRIVNEPIRRKQAAWYGQRRLTLNYGVLGKGWFDQGLGSSWNELLLHEFAHEKVSDHLTREFSDECCRLAAKLFTLAMNEPLFFKDCGW